MPDLQGIKKKLSKGKKKQANKVAPDFTKTKAKVGRKLEKTNETKTTYKAKKLSLSRQSVAVDRGGKELSRRGLTLWEIASQIAHYSANVRKDALSGMKDFFTLHPALIDSNVGPVFEKISDLVADQDASVRREFRALSSFLLKEADKSSLAPFLDLYLVHVCGGLSHVQDTIRSDTLALLDDLVPLYPAVAANKSTQILPLYIHMLSTGEGGNAVAASTITSSSSSSSASSTEQLPRLRTMSRSARVSIMRSLHAFLQAVTSSSPTTKPHNAADRDGNDGAPEPRAEATREWVPNKRICLRLFSVDGRDASARRSLGSEGLSAGAGKAADASTSESAKRVLCLLMQAWGEYLPLETGKGLADAVDGMLLILDILAIVVGMAPALLAFASAAPEEGKASLYRQVVGVGRGLMSVFPLGYGDVLNGATGGAMRRLNRAMCDVLTGVLESGGGERDAGRVREAVLEFYGQELAEVQGGSGQQGAAADGGKGAKGEKKRKLNGEAVAGIVPSLMRLMPPEMVAGQGWGSGVEEAVLEGVTACWERVGARDAGGLKAAGVRLMGQQLRLWPQHAPAMAARWIQALPKLLWTLQARDPALSLAALRLVASLARRVPPGGGGGGGASGEVAGLQKKLEPLFRAKIGGVEEAGPFVQLPAECQAAALEALYYLAPLQESMLAAVAAVLSLPEVADEVVGRAMAMVEMLVEAGTQSLPSAVSFCLTVAMRGSQEEEEEEEGKEEEGKGEEGKGEEGKGEEGKGEEGKGGEGGGQGEGGGRGKEDAGALARGLRLLERSVETLRAMEVAGSMGGVLRGAMAGLMGGALGEKSRHELRALVKLQGQWGHGPGGGGEEERCAALCVALLQRGSGGGEAAAAAQREEVALVARALDRRRGLLDPTLKGLRREWRQGGGEWAAAGLCRLLGEEGLASALQAGAGEGVLRELEAECAEGLRGSWEERVGRAVRTVQAVRAAGGGG